MKIILIILLTLIIALITTPAFAVNRVLSLDGDGDYVEITDSESLNAINSQVTMEAWIKATAFKKQWMPIIYNGDKHLPNGENRSYVLLWLGSADGLRLSSTTSSEMPIYLWAQISSMALNTWYHVAGIIDGKSGLMKIFLNGSEVASGDFGKDIRVSSLPLRIGWTYEADHQDYSPFEGQIDEVRIWNIARTPEEIQRTMNTVLSGTEPGLVGYWRFDDLVSDATRNGVQNDNIGNTVTDSSPNRSEGKLIGDAHFAEAELPKRGELVIPTVLSGIIKNEAGQPIPNASVHLERDGEEIVKTQTGASGSYRITILHPERGIYDLSAISGELGVWRLGIRLSEGERRKLNLTLKKAISIEGTLLMLDDATPHVAVPVQALRNGKVLDGTLSDESGKYRFLNLKPGSYQLRCQVLDGYVYYRTTGDVSRVTFYDAAMREGIGDLLQVEGSKSLKGIDFHFPPFKKGRWKTYTTLDGLACNSVHSIHCDADGMMWFATMGGGVSRYDGKQFLNLTQEDGLASNLVMSLYADADGVMWFGTYDGGVCRYDGKSPFGKGGFKTFTQKDGLGSNTIGPIYRDRDGALWFGTGFGGISPHLWGGVSRYDGKEFQTFTTKDGLAGDEVDAIHQDPNGMMWFGTVYYGVSRYDGNQFQTFTTKDGLADNRVWTIHRDINGALWFGTWGGGVSRYDGITWTSLDTRDGLAGDIVYSIHEDADGSLWFGTDGGVTRYRRSTAPPTVRIVSVTTDREYTDVESIPPITTGNRVTIKYNAIDFKTVPEKRQYRYRLRELDGDWRSPTKETSFDDSFDKPGTYTFEAQAIDRDLNYSEPVSVTLHVKRPWWIYAFVGMLIAGIPLTVGGFYVGKRLQTQRAIAQQFNPYIAGRVVGEDLFYGRNDLITDIERTLHNNCFLLYGERRIGKTSLQHQLRERLSKADDPTYKFIPAYIDLQGVAEEDFFRTIAASIVEHAASLFRGTLTLRLNEDRERYTYRDLSRDLRTILDHFKENETKTIKLVLLMDEVDTLNTYSLRANLNLRGLFMGPLKENLVLIMSGLYLKMDWSAEGGGSPPFNFLSREIQIQPLDEESARDLITEPIKGFYSYESQAVDLILQLSELRPFTIQGFCLRAVNRILAAGRTKITSADIEAIKESVLAEVLSIRGERAGTSLPASLNEALALLNETQSRVVTLEVENARLRQEVA